MKKNLIWPHFLLICIFKSRDFFRYSYTIEALRDLWYSLYSCSNHQSLLSSHQFSKHFQNRFSFPGQNKFLKLALPLPYRDVFSDFPEFGGQGTATWKLLTMPFRVVVCNFVHIPTTFLQTAVDLQWKPKPTLNNIRMFSKVFPLLPSEWWGKDGGFWQMHIIVCSI